jgi:cytosine/adenosine deaminase-related metal-dependent hydrolase
VRDGRYVSTLRQLTEAGCFDGPTLLTHGNQLADADLALMAEHGIGLCTTPGTEGGMGLGPMRARALAERGGAAALGTDLTSYAGADLLREARHLLLAERRDAASTEGALPHELAWSARAVFELATSGGARALGLGDETGSITPGKRADLVVVAPDPVRAAPAVDPLATLVFYTNPADIETVLVQGVVRKRGGVLTDVDTTALPPRSADALRRVGERRATLPPAYAQAWAGLF